MITTAKFKSAVLQAGRRILKVVQFGPKTAFECAPFGDDSNPLDNTKAIFAETSESGEAIVLGYIQKNQLAAAGEKRLFSLKPDGTLSFYAWLKNDGTLLLGGDEYHLVRFEPLESGLHAQDSLLNAELNKIATAIGMVGGSYVPGSISTNISQSKINEIKCI